MRIITKKKIFKLGFVENIVFLILFAASAILHK